MISWVKLRDLFIGKPKPIVSKPTSERGAVFKHCADCRLFLLCSLEGHCDKMGNGYR